MIAYDGRKYKPAEANYTGEQELLAAVSALQVWRCYLEGSPKFTVLRITIHSSGCSQQQPSRRHSLVGVPAAL
jgi:hypothetical protein